MMSYEKSLIATATKKRSAQYIVEFFPNADLRAGHAGLSAVAKEHGLNTDNLKPGEYLVFVNRKRSMLKMYTAGNIIAHLKASGQGLITWRVVKYIPKFFNGTEINFKAAQREALRDQAPELFKESTR